MSTKRGQKPGFSGGASSNGKPTSGPANAWARPLQSKTGPPPGMGHLDKKSAAGTNSGSNSNGASLAMINRERLLHLSLTLVGQKVVVAQTNGSVLEGIFHTFTPFPGLSAEMKNRYVFNTVKVIKPPTSGDNAIKDGSTAIIPADKVVYVHAKNINLDRPSANGGTSFAPAGKPKSDVMTDTQISGSRGGRDRDLVAAGTAWTTTGGGSRQETLAPVSDMGGGNTRAKGLQGSIGEWDQFKANEELFNVNASYDENLYTTALDKSQLDSRKIAEAERIAREIEKTTSANIHIAEERGHVVETDFDEEDRYSGVLTKDGKQRHTVGSKETETKKPTTESKGETAKSNGSSAAPKMNYAAAAAKADTKKATPPGFSGKASTATPATPASSDEKSSEPVAKVTPESKKDDETEQPKSEEKPESDEKTAEISAEPEDDGKKVDSSDAAEKPDSTEKPKGSGAEKDTGKESKDNADAKAENEKKSETKGAAKTSKLNANAKAFSFNPNAKSFTPSFGGSSTLETQPPPPQQQQQQQPQQVAEIHAPMQMHAGGHPMQQPHYMHAPMGQPGMMHMMNPQFQGMRYPPQYGGMDQNVAHMQQQAQAPPQAPAAPQPPAAAPSTASGTSEEEAAQPQEGEGSQPPAPQQPQPGAPPQMQVQYGPPPGAYFAGQNMAMHPRGPGFSPQFVGAPQQMPGVPGGASYRHGYPMQPGTMPPNMHMRGPGAPPYYPGPNGPMPYPPGAYSGHGMVDDNDPGFRGRGRGGGRGRGRRGGRGRGGPGRGGQSYQSYGGAAGGRQTPQQHAPGDQGGAPEGAAAKDGKSGESGAGN